MKIYVSQSISGKTAKEYLEERKEIIRQIKMEYGVATKIVGSYVKDKWDIIDISIKLSLRPDGEMTMLALRNMMNVCDGELKLSTI